MIAGLPRRYKGTHRLEGHVNKDRGRDEHGKSTSWAFLATKRKEEEAHKDSFLAEGEWHC